MKRLLCLLCTILLFSDLSAQEWYPDKISQNILKNIRPYDSIIIFGDVCSGCVPGSIDTFYVVYVRKHRAYLSIYSKPNNESSYNTNSYQLPKSNAYYGIYFEHAGDIEQVLKRGEAVFNDTIRSSSGKILVGGTLSDGRGQFFYFRFNGIEVSNFYCCGISNYRDRAMGLWLLMEEFKHQSIK